MAVRDIRAVLSFLATPEDDLSLATALRSPLFGLGEDQLYRLAAPRKGRLWPALRDAAEHRGIVDLLSDLQEQADFIRPHDLMARLLIRHGGREKLVARLGHEAEDGIDALMSQALVYEQAEPPSLTGFLVWLAEDDAEALVRLVARAIGIRDEPAKPADEDRRDHEDLRRALDQRADEGRRTIVVGVHSFTPVFLGVARPWPVGVLYGRAERFGRALIERLSVELGPDAPVGDNEPYRIEPEEHDYTVPVHGDARGLDAALLELRQDVIASAAEAEAWAARLAPVFADVAREDGATAMVLSSLAQMAAAHRVYGRLGYSRAPDRDWDPAPGVHLVAFVKELA